MGNTNRTMPNSQKCPKSTLDSAFKDTITNMNPRAMFGLHIGLEVIVHRADRTYHSTTTISDLSSDGMVIMLHGLGTLTHLPTITTGFDWSDTNNEHYWITFGITHTEYLKEYAIKWFNEFGIMPPTF